VDLKNTCTESAGKHDTVYGTNIGRHNKKQDTQQFHFPNDSSNTPNALVTKTGPT